MKMRGGLMGQLIILPESFKGVVTKDLKRYSNFSHSFSLLIDGSSDKDSGLWKPDGLKGECGIRSTSRRTKRVVGGKSSELAEFPYNVLVGYEIDNEDFTDGINVYYFAGGSVVNKWYIITAAHEFDGHERTLR